MEKMKKEYAVLAQHKYQQADNKWSNVGYYLGGPSKRFFSTESEAKAALNEYVAKWNKEYVYGSDGKRIETSACGCVGVDCITDKKTDDDMRVTSWKIKVREVTPWEEFEEG